MRSAASIGRGAILFALGFSLDRRRRGVVAKGGVIPESRTGITGDSDSSRRRGVMQGLFIFLLSFLVVPILTIISIALNLEPYFVVISALLFGVGGLLRIAYALMFESGDPLATERNNVLTEPEVRTALPPSQSIPAAAYASPSAGSAGHQ